MPLLRSLTWPVWSDDSLNARPSCCPLPLAPAKCSVTRPPTSLPKSSTSAAPAPDSRVGAPVSTFCGEPTDPVVLWTATGARVRLDGA